MNKKILGIGNAIVDVFAYVDDSFLRQNNLVKGSMKLIKSQEFFDLKKNIKVEKIVAGGSAANTMVGISYLNGSASFIGKINNDEFGNIYKKSLEKENVNFVYNEKNEELTTGACIVLITPDSERTMCTYLGISSTLSANDINNNNIKNHELIFLEGYLWDEGESEKMFEQAINLAKLNHTKISMSLSDTFCVTRHKKSFNKLLRKDLDILIGNENEILELTNTKDLKESINLLKEINKLIVITRSENGSLAIFNKKIFECRSVKVDNIIDVTGAGDLFAAGFLKEYIDGSNIDMCLNRGSIIAAQIIQRIGARLN